MILLKIPFDTHTIYITFNDGIFFELKRDLSTIKVENIQKPTRQNPIFVLHKSQFDIAKEYLLNKDNPNKMDVETSLQYYQIGFLTKDDLQKFSNTFKHTIVD